MNGIYEAERDAARVEVDTLRAKIEAVEAACDEVEARRLHIPPSDHPDRMKAIVQRSTTNRILRVVRAALAGAVPGSPGGAIGRAERFAAAGTDAERIAVLVEGLPGSPPEPAAACAHVRHANLWSGERVGWLAKDADDAERWTPCPSVAAGSPETPATTEETKR